MWTKIKTSFEALPKKENTMDKKMLLCVISVLKRRYASA